MDVREAEPDDGDEIRRVASESLHASYEEVIDGETVERAVEEWYGPDEIDHRMADDDLVFLLAEDDEVIGFSQSHLRDHEGRIQWLHVSPGGRGQGVGSRLLTATRDALLERGVERISGAVLADHDPGNEFYREHGFTIEDQRTVQVGGEMVAENVYHDAADVDRELDATETTDGEMYVDRGDRTRGKEAPFFPVFRSSDGGERYAWLCGNCGTIDNAMNANGRITCNVCDNVHKADRWDGAYL
jgi:ribosomal protein S18 acetylase RimI-like enzyme